MAANGKGINVVGEINQAMRFVIDDEVIFQLKNYIIIKAQLCVS